MKPQAQPPDLAGLPPFSGISKPRVLGLFVGNGVGSKLLQGYLDGSEELYMLPAYPLMYFYPHWRDWELSHHGRWDWNTIISLFCEKHASVIDSRRIPGLNGLRNLGPAQDAHIEIDENLFREALRRILQDEPVSSRTFVLSVHYAYHFCRGEDIRKKGVLLYHVHVPHYLDALLKDFPDARIIAMTRDPRSNFERRVKAAYNVDAEKLTKSDTYLFRALPTYHLTRYILQDMQWIASKVDPEHLCVLRHEDLGPRLESALKALCAWSDLPYGPKMLNITFGGKEWWGDKVYGMPPTNSFNPRVLAKSWRDHGFTEIFVVEGLMADFLEKYDYEPEKYLSDSAFNRLLLAILLWWPCRSEWSVLAHLLSPRSIATFLKTCIKEASGQLPLKDYTWNATHRYKWMYIELKLWKTRPHVRWMQALRQSGIPGREAIARVVYVTGQSLRYLYALACLPYWYLRRRNVELKRLAERWGAKAQLPEPLIPV